MFMRLWEILVFSPVLAPPSTMNVADLFPSSPPPSPLIPLSAARYLPPMNKHQENPGLKALCRRFLWLLLAALPALPALAAAAAD